MSLLMLCLTTTAPALAVFRVLADVEAFPLWAAEYCERLELSRGRWVAWTVAGDLLIDLEADARTGVVDLRLGEDGGCERFLSMRVLTPPGGGTLVSGLLFAGAGEAAGGNVEARILEAALRDLLARLEREEAPAEPLALAR
jgi:hypothetical protein